MKNESFGLRTAKVEVEILRDETVRMFASAGRHFEAHRKSTQFPILIASLGARWKESGGKGGSLWMEKHNQKSQLVSESR